MANLYIIATPIGNLADATPRMGDVIQHLDVLACEDTRHTGNLLALLNIPKPPIVISNHEYNENQNANRIVAYLNEGKNVGICSDAGYPLMSDPGYPAVRAAIDAGHQIIPIPGASAIPMALIISGLPCSSYTFKGFPPRKPGARKTFFEMDRELPHTLVFYESPFRIGKLLEEAYSLYGNRKCAVCLELSKQFERCDRGTLSELSLLYKDKKVKGEAVVVIEGNTRRLLKTQEEESSNSPD